MLYDAYKLSYRKTIKLVLKAWTSLVEDNTCFVIGPKNRPITINTFETPTEEDTQLKRVWQQLSERKVVLYYSCPNTKFDVSPLKRTKIGHFLFLSLLLFLLTLVKPLFVCVLETKNWIIFLHFNSHFTALFI